MLDHDELVRRGFERLSHTASRHQFLEKAAKGLLATLTTLTVGGLTAQTVLANVGCCCDPTAVQCPNCPGQGGKLLCPSGYSTCTCIWDGTKCTSSRCGYCDWHSGYWTCFCGSSGVYCLDCWNGNTCTNPAPCTCASSCVSNC